MLEQRRRSVSDEHKENFDDYFKSAVKITTKLEGLTGWSDELRGQFWGEILSESPSNSETGRRSRTGMGKHHQDPSEADGWRLTETTGGY